MHVSYVAETYERMFNTFYDETHQVISIREWSALARLVAVTSSPQPLHIADLGCGTGRYLVPLIRLLTESGRSARIYAIDIVKSVPRRIARRLAVAGFRPIEISPNEMRIQDIEIIFSVDHRRDFASSCAALVNAGINVDIAMSFLSFLSHVPSDGARRQVLSDIGQLLKPNGALVMTLPNGQFTYLKGQQRADALNSCRNTVPGPFRPGDAIIHPFAGCVNVSGHSASLFCHTFSVDEINFLLRDADLVLEGAVRAAKCVDGYHYIGAGESQRALNLNDALACGSVIEPEVEQTARDFLVVATRAPLREVPRSNASLGMFATVRLDTLERHFFVDAIAIAAWQAGTSTECEHERECEN